MSYQEKLNELGLALPPPLQLPPGVELPYSPIKISGNICYVSGHIAQNPDGTVMEPLGRLGTDVSLQQGVEAARGSALAMLGSLQRELGDLDRIEGWLSVFGMVNTSADFHAHPIVINGFSNLILEIFGPEAGSHTRSAIGVAGLPINTPVEVEAVIELKA